ncbi:hypothetical protein DL93DRAFT_2233252 [Clavulina sp. PMI_390]|nr:hypothetical protein DL93DRAFT_2233252 [Clavulina sp. PMI_390]
MPDDAFLDWVFAGSASIRDAIIEDVTWWSANQFPFHHQFTVLSIKYNPLNTPPSMYNIILERVGKRPGISLEAQHRVTIQHAQSVGGFSSNNRLLLGLFNAPIEERDSNSIRWDWIADLKELMFCQTVDIPGFATRLDEKWRGPPATLAHVARIIEHIVASGPQYKIASTNCYYFSRLLVHAIALRHYSFSSVHAVAVDLDKHVTPIAEGSRRTPWCISHPHGLPHVPLLPHTTTNMGNELLLPTASTPSRGQQKRPRWSSLLIATIAGSLLFLITHWSSLRDGGVHQRTTHVVPMNAQEILDECAALYTLPGPPSDFADRSVSDRYDSDSIPTHITNATIWTGNDNGNEVIRGGELFLLNGLVKIRRMNAQLAWVSPAIVDMHSHLGVGPVPDLKGARDTNSRKGLTLPWLRSLDGIDTHDQAYALSISGGVATSLILPGSADAIGGQAFVIKLRETKERTPLSRVLEPPYSLLNGTRVDPSIPPRWRHMKHATGENPSRVYQGTRMDTIWAFRSAYNEARKLKLEQDAYCAKAQAHQWTGLPAQVPKDLQWEALVDVLRGRVKVNPSQHLLFSRMVSNSYSHLSAFARSAPGQLPYLPNQ